MPAGRIRILIAEDHAVVREALAALLRAGGAIEVVGSAADGHEAVRRAQELRPDVVLMDAVMPGLNGVEATRQIRRQLPRTRVLMLTGYGDDERVLASLEAGASGYVMKRSDPEELVLAIQAVHRGNSYFSSELSARTDPRELMVRSRRGESRSLLTPREREVLQLISEGYVNREIADRLVISPKTVEVHRANIMQKLGARSRADLVRYALEQGLVTPAPPGEMPPVKGPGRPESDASQGPGR